jgi:hypothetical protein
MSKLTRTQAQEAEQRFLMALYYAYGRSDAGAKVDPMAFAKHYARMFEDLQAGVAGHCPSVQDAFGYYVGTVAGTSTSTLLHNDDEPVA